MKYAKKTIYKLSLIPKLLLCSVSKSFLLKILKMEKNEIKKIWKKSLIIQSDWFFVKDYLTSDWWCTNTNPRYLINENFDVKEVDGKKMFRPKVLQTVC